MSQLVATQFFIFFPCCWWSCHFLCVLRLCVKKEQTEWATEMSNSEFCVRDRRALSWTTSTSCFHSKKKSHFLFCRQQRYSPIRQWFSTTSLSPPAQLDMCNCWFFPNPGNCTSFLAFENFAVNCSRQRSSFLVGTCGPTRDPTKSSPHTVAKWMEETSKSSHWWFSLLSCFNMFGLPGWLTKCFYLLLVSLHLKILHSWHAWRDSHVCRLSKWKGAGPRFSVLFGSRCQITGWIGRETHRRHRHQFPKQTFCLRFDGIHLSWNRRLFGISQLLKCPPHQGLSLSTGTSQSLWGPPISRFQFSSDGYKVTIFADHPSILIVDCRNVQPRGNNLYNSDICLEMLWFTQDFSSQHFTLEPERLWSCRLQLFSDAEPCWCHRIRMLGQQSQSCANLPQCTKTLCPDIRSFQPKSGQCYKGMGWISVQKKRYSMWKIPPFVIFVIVLFRGGGRRYRHNAPHKIGSKTTDLSV